MKTWERYRDMLPWADLHVHTSHTEGMSSVGELCDQAVRNNLRLIAFTEHVRRSLSYDYSALLSDIDDARKRFPGLTILSGCEAAVRDTAGTLDVSMEVLERADIVVASFHGFPYGHKREFLSALRGALSNPRVDIWGHPQTFLRNVELSPSETREILELCRDSRVMVEDSLQKAYRTPPGFLSMAREVGAVVATNSDAHSSDELRFVPAGKQ